MLRSLEAADKGGDPATMLARVAPVDSYPSDRGGRRRRRGQTGDLPVADDIMLRQRLASNTSSIPITPLLPSRAGPTR
jgi:hypothetical protein